jgi:multicomponent Na+:H+ antiporter subunit G
VSAVLDVVAMVFLLLGSFLAFTAGLGLLHFPDVLTRLHAATKPQVTGLLLILVGGAIRLAGTSAMWALLLVALLQVLTAPLSAHMVSRIAYRRRHVRRDLLLVDEVAEQAARDREADPGLRGD